MTTEVSVPIRNIGWAEGSRLVVEPEQFRLFNGEKMEAMVSIGATHLATLEMDKQIECPTGVVRALVWPLDEMRVAHIQYPVELEKVGWNLAVVNFDELVEAAKKVAQSADVAPATEPTSPTETPAEQGSTPEIHMDADERREGSPRHDDMTFFGTER